MNRAVVTRVVPAALVLAIGFSLFSIRRIHDLENRLGNIAAESDLLGQRATNLAARLDTALDTASLAHDRAKGATAQAVQAATAQAAAEDDVRSAEQAKVRAEQETLESRRQLAAIRQRRQEELNRMQEALARIASTRRTDAGLVVNLAGDSFRFQFDQASLQPANRELLSRIAGVLLVSNGYRLFVDGYTDDVGTQEYNQRLSERRAEGVAKYLVSAGVDPGILEVRGFGKSTPRALSRTSEARSQNRRVEIVVVDSIVRYEGPVAEDGTM